jgi:phage shock protein PspC (stress-responsive transcriptional regulator)
VQKVITINLNGNAYQLDENALDELRAYLDTADAQLAANPDKTEIMADLEQAIGEKCRRFLGPHKTVVTAKEIEQVLGEMGPVDGGHAETGKEPVGPGDGAPPGPRPAGPASRRLYRIREGAMAGGVCNGIAAYFGIDPTFVRIAFVALAVVTGGGWGLAYLVFMWVVPPANTSEEQAAAQGAPFTAQELVDEAKRNYAEFKNTHWDNQQGRWAWRQQRREMRRQWRQARRGWGAPPAPPPGYAGQVAHGIFSPVFGILTAVLSIVLVVAILWVVRRGGVFGLYLPFGVPRWVGIVALVIIYQAVVSPLRFMRWGAWHPGYGAYWHPAAMFGGLFWMACWVFLFWYGFHHVDALRTFFQHLLNVSETPGGGVRI